MASVTRRIEREMERSRPLQVKNLKGVVIYQGGVRRWNRIIAHMKARPYFRRTIEARIEAGLRVH